MAGVNIKVDPAQAGAKGSGVDKKKQDKEKKKK